MIYDCIIIGTGPAGISAALTLKTHGKKFLIFGSKNLSEKINRAEKVLNYPGLPAVSGKELSDALKAHLDQMNIEITDKMVTSVIKMGDNYAVTAQTDFFEAKTLILATGVTSAALVENESALLGRGVSYCATCDGGLYKGKKIAVICTNQRFEHEVKYLSDLAETVYFFPTYKNSGNELGENVKMPGSFPVSAKGEDRLSGIQLKNGENIEVSGLFCLRDCIAPNMLLSGMEVSEGHIVTDKGMRTNFKGCFACGDCTGRPYQYVKAAGEGNVAALGAIEMLDS